MDNLTAVKNALVERLRRIDKEFCIEGKIEDINPCNAIELFKNGGAKKNCRHIFKIKDSFCAVFDGYFIAASKAIKEYKDKFLVYLFVGDMNNRPYNKRIEYLQKLISGNAEQYAGGYAGMLDFLGFYDYEPIVLNKSGEIKRVLSCTPIENLFAKDI
jgi:hypothetical protein